jgi:hypothetical protein
VVVVGLGFGEGGLEGQLAKIRYRWKYVIWGLFFLLFTLPELNSLLPLVSLFWQSLFRVLKLRKLVWEPKHASHLSNVFYSFANYPSARLGGFDKPYVFENISLVIRVCLYVCARGCVGCSVLFIFVRASGSKPLLRPSKMLVWCHDSLFSSFLPPLYFFYYYYYAIVLIWCTDICMDTLVSHARRWWHQGPQSTPTHLLGATWTVSGPFPGCSALSVLYELWGIPFYLGDSKMEVNATEQMQETVDAVLNRRYLSRLFQRYECLFSSAEKETVVENFWIRDLSKRSTRFSKTTFHTRIEAPDISFKMSGKDEGDRMQETVDAVLTRRYLSRFFGRCGMPPQWLY